MQKMSKRKKIVHLVHLTSHSLWVIPCNTLEKTEFCVILNDSVEGTSGGGLILESNGLAMKGF